MKKLLNVTLITLSIIIFILSLAFIVIEGRLLFSTDWIIYNNALNGLIRYLFRLLLSILACLISIFEIINVKNQKYILQLFVADVGLLIISSILFVFSTNYVGIVCLTLSILLIANKLLILKQK